MLATAARVDYGVAAARGRLRIQPSTLRFFFCFFSLHFLLARMLHFLFVRSGTHLCLGLSLVGNFVQRAACYRGVKDLSACYSLLHGLARACVLRSA